MPQLSNAATGALAMAFLAGAIVMMFFVLLSGLNDISPLKDTYFLRADTSGITGAKPITQWTYFWICGEDNKDCDSPHAALPFGYAWDSNPENAPNELVGNHGANTTSRYYFYIWRFGWVFYIIALFFTVCALFSGVFACLGRLGARLAGLASIFALVFYTVAVSLMTVEFVKARDAFTRVGRDASIGKYAFGFSWGAWTAMFIAIVIFCTGGRKDKHQTYSSRKKAGGSFGARFFGRGRSRTPARPVKDEYH